MTETGVAADGGRKVTAEAGVVANAECKRVVAETGVAAEDGERGVEDEEGRVEPHD